MKVKDKIKNWLIMNKKDVDYGMSVWFIFCSSVFFYFIAVHAEIIEENALIQISLFIICFSVLMSLYLSTINKKMLVCDK